ncbi:hypothetical protein [Salirhabdus sp. Marseille-P4669]|uniref:hypothetical protein n=1 Tax=Salirhabdus sp. Marseille-P4669 TaxID=2042310 RepID=UPI000C7A4EA2|nr:hypothetical protein [Salirhabdus sp. Marseille-P4669]
MRGFNRGVVSVALIVFTLALLDKGYQLWKIKEFVADSTVDVTFLKFTINNDVPGEHLIIYAIVFWILGIITFLIFLLPIVYTYVRGRRNKKKN